MFDIKQLTANPVITEEETASRRLMDKKTETVIGMLVNLQDTDESVKTTFKKLGPMVEQVLFDLKNEGFKINDYAMRFLEKTADEIDTYIMSDCVDENSRKTCVILTIERLQGVTYASDTTIVSYLLVLNFMQVKNGDRKTPSFVASDAHTLAVVTVPLTKTGILDYVGEKTELVDVIKLAGKSKKS
jgi:hypothetical protein